ncbi:secretion-regulating guanine nucleotide exchange factor-like [Liolophura sinensis]|uniref:secretion-regulating guanine nucleotide exchange factor-like n=1 Tax=Liolophura sinensis TaxID=3198878 RepID=UPI0031584ABC
MAALTASTPGNESRAVMAVYSWGANSYGQLSTGRCEEKCEPGEITLPFMPSQAVELSGGGGHSLLVTESGKLFTCGSNSRGQLGVGHSQDVLTLTKVTLPEGAKVLKAVGGWDFTLALTEGGFLYGWGSNTFGQLGLPDVKGHISYPRLVDVITEPLTDVAAGLRHAAAVTASGILYTWGSGRRGQLGWTDNTGKPPGQVFTPSPVDFPSDSGRPVSVTAGSLHTAALTDRGEVFIWGCNKHGQGSLPPSTAISINKPFRVESFKLGDVQISAVRSGWTHILCQTETGYVMSWGRGDYGQLGRPCTEAFSHTPGRIPDLIRVSQIACGSEHNLAVTDGRLVSWGWGEHGMCGQGAERNVEYPLLIGQLKSTKATLIGCGAGHSWAVVEI